MTFETLWKDHLSVSPEVPVNWKEQEKFKAFAKRVYDMAVMGDEKEKLLHDAYQEGYDEGCDEGRESAIEELHDFISRMK